jgi:hypothetical protein
LLILLGAIVAVVTTAGGSTASAAVLIVRPPSVATRTPPARAKPSKTTRMICAREARVDLAGVLGLKPTRMTTPTWVGDRYSCDYVYPEGTVTLSVKQLGNAASTTAYFDALGTSLGRRPGDLGLGQGAFQVPDGSIVVRKDFEVLQVDVTKVSQTFGKAKLTPSAVASTFAVTILGCWQG